MTERDTECLKQDGLVYLCGLFDCTHCGYDELNRAVKDRSCLRGRETQHVSMYPRLQ